MLIYQVYHITLGVIIALVAVLIIAKRLGGKGSNAAKSGIKRSGNRNRRR